MTVTGELEWRRDKDCNRTNRLAPRETHWSNVVVGVAGPPGGG